MDIAFYLKKIITALILPPTSLLIALVAGLLLMKRFARLGYTLVWVSVTALFALSLPVVSSELLRTASTHAPLQMSDANTKAARAIVILGGGRRHAPEYGGETISSLALERVRYGAKLAGALNLPILVTGGVVYGQGESEAAMMAQALTQSFNVEAKWIEGRSRDTHENALFTATLLAHDGIEAVILVTQDFHMRRSVIEFETAGLRVVPAPVTYTPERRARSFPEHLPNASALMNSGMAMHELLGYWAARLR
jgi:uncharacterized SAM-binding protein YcdF (DUF218 family)